MMVYIGQELICDKREFHATWKNVKVFNNLNRVKKWISEDEDYRSFEVFEVED